MSKSSIVISYLLVWAVSVAAFWLFAKNADAIGYSITVLWIILPIVTFVLSFVIGKHDFWRKCKWISAGAFGLMYMLAEYATFSMANNIAFNKINVPEFPMLIAGIIISLIGIEIGNIMQKK